MLARQLATERAPHAVDRASEDRAVGPREVHQLEDATLVWLRRQRGQAIDLRRGPLNSQELARLELADGCGTDEVERAGLRREDVASAQLAEPERAEPARIDDRVERPPDRHDQRIRALDALEGVEQLILWLAGFGARNQVNQDFAVR